MQRQGEETKRQRLRETDRQERHWETEYKRDAEIEIEGRDKETE